LDLEEYEAFDEKEHTIKFHRTKYLRAVSLKKTRRSGPRAFRQGYQWPSAAALGLLRDAHVFAGVEPSLAKTFVPIKPVSRSRTRTGCSTPASLRLTKGETIVAKQALHRWTTRGNRNTTGLQEDRDHGQQRKTLFLPMGDRSSARAGAGQPDADLARS